MSILGCVFVYIGLLLICVSFQSQLDKKMENKNSYGKIGFSKFNNAYFDDDKQAEVYVLTAQKESK